MIHFRIFFWLCVVAILVIISMPGVSNATDTNSDAQIETISPGHKWRVHRGVVIDVTCLSLDGFFYTQKNTTFYLGNRKIAYYSKKHFYFKSFATEKKINCAIWWE